MSQENIRSSLEQRLRLEQKVKALGGEIPPRLPWDEHGYVRNNQLIELIEDLERKPNV